MARLLALVLILGSALLARAGEHTTPGAIARVDVPDGFTARYDPNSDVSLLSRGAGAQIMLIAGPDLPPRDTMRQLLQLFGVQHLAPRVRDSTLAGFEGVRLDVETQVHERWTVLDLGRSSVVVRAASTVSFEDLHDATVSVVTSLETAPATHPPLVAGHYETGVTRSGAGDLGSSDDVSVYAESGVRLLPDGRLRESGFAGGSSGTGTVTSESSGRGRWEVRGQRLIMVHADGTLSNFRVKAFSNGLELWNAQGGKLVWVRK